MGKVSMKKGNVIAGIILILVLVGILAVKDTESTTYIASNANDEIILHTGEVLSQSWLSEQKKIGGFVLQLANVPQTVESGSIKMELKDRESGEILVSEERVLAELQGSSLSFRFPVIKMKPVRELEVLLELNGDPNGEVVLKVNNDYSGCKINGEDKDCGLGSEFIYVKNSAVFVVMVSLGIIFALAISLSLLTKHEFADTSGVIAIGICLVLYICAMAGNASVGIYLIEGLAACGLIYILYCLFTNRCQVKNILSFGMAAVGIFFLFTIVYNYGTIITESDEFSHWALATKDLFYSDKLYSHEGTTVMFTRYPPLMSLFQYYFMSVNQLFSDKFLFIAYQLFGFLLLSVILRKQDGIKKKVVLSGVLFLFPLLFNTNYYNKIMIDGFLGILFAYVLYCFFFEEMDLFNLIRLIFGMSALVLTKEMGVVLAGLAGMVFLIYTVWEQRKLGTRKEWQIILTGIIALAVFGSWQIYCQMHIGNVTEKGMADAIQMISGGGHDVEDKVSFFLQTVLSNINSVWNGIKIGPFSVLTVLVIFLFAAYSIKKRTDRKKEWVIMGLLITGSVVYFLCIVFLYVTVFPIQDALTAASLDRYLFSYVSGIVFLMVAYIATYGRKETEYIRIGILGLAVLFLAPTSGLFAMNQYVEKRQSILWGYDKIEENFQSFLNKDDTVFFWCDDSQKLSHYIFQYYMCPIHAQSGNTGCSFTYHEADEEKVDDISEIEKIIGKYDYVYLANYSKEQEKYYGSLIGKGVLQDGGIYRVENTQNGVKLVLQGYSPIQRFY